MSGGVKRIVAGLLALSCVQLGAAWLWQSQAASDLGTARRLSETEVEESGGGAQSLEDYRAVLATLNESIGIRSEIDGHLSEVERIIAELRSQQAVAEATAAEARAQVSRIAEALGGALDAARDSIGSLSSLGGGVETSATLARLIADELEEMDRKLGPTVP